MMFAKAILFDLDGVIVSTDQYHYEAWKQLADEENIPYSKEVNSLQRGVSRMESLEIMLRNTSKIYSDSEKLILAEKKNNIYIEKIKNIKPDDILDGVNNELNQASWKVNVRAYNSALKLIKQESFDGNGSIDRTKKLGSFELNAEQTSTAPLFIVTEVEKNGTLASRNYSFINYEEEVGSLFILPRTSLSYTISDNTVTVKNDGKVPAVAVSFNTSDSTKMLPDDSYFWLEAGESKTVVMKDATLLTGVISWNNKDESNTTKPSSPTNLEAKSTEKGIKLSWDTSKDKDVIGYNIYRDGELIDYVSLNNTSYIDKNVSANKTYSYTVRAVDAGDNLSEASNTATVKAEFDVGADISPKTGDRSHIVLFTILCFISIIVSLAFEGYIRRKDDIARAK